MMNQFADTIAEMKSYVSQEVGAFTRTITSRDAMFGDSALNDLIHDLQFSVCESEFGTEAGISFAAPLQFDKTIEAGPVYVRDMYNL